MAGFPIRKSPDHSLFIDSPRHIADYNVLHRFLVPRHPPCALKNLRSRATWETAQHSHTRFVYGSRTLYAQPFKIVQLRTWFLTAHPHVSEDQHCPTTPQPQPLTGLTRSWFSLIRFRSPLLTESLLFSLPVGTEMFHFPTFPPNTLCVQVQVP